MQAGLHEQVLGATGLRSYAQPCREALAAWLQRAEALQELDFSGNMIKDEGAKAPNCVRVDRECRCK